MKTIPRFDEPRLRIVHGVWTVRKQIDGKRFERSLGTADRDVALERAKIILAAYARGHLSETWAGKVAEALTPTSGWLWRLWNNACRRRPDSRLTIEEIRQVALRSGGYCEVSGISFTLDRKMHPCQPSLDRLDGKVSYQIDNCRLVALSVNFCMGRWGEEVFRSLSLSMARRYLEKLEEDQGIRSWCGANAETDKSGPPKPYPTWLPIHGKREQDQ